MTKNQLDTEVALQKRHAAREVKRAATFVLNVVLALLVGGLATLPQVVLNDFNPWITAVGVVGVLVCLLGFPVSHSNGIGPSFCASAASTPLKGPGAFAMIPFLDSVARYVDMRIRATKFFSEDTLTRDTVPVAASMFGVWMAWDAKKAVCEVDNFYRAIALSTQTALRDTIGTHTLEQMLTQGEA